MLPIAAIALAAEDVGSGLQPDPTPRSCSEHLIQRDEGERWNPPHVAASFALAPDDAKR
jgi:hypothetical protein